MKPTVVLQENILSKMALPDRKRLGKAGRTQKEIAAANYKKSERNIHNQFISFLRRHELPYVHSDPTRKSSIAAGHPDFLITRGDRSIYVEFKIPPNQLSPAQIGYINFLIRNRNTVQVIVEIAPGGALNLASELLTKIFNLVDC